MAKNDSIPKLGDPLSRRGRLHAGCILNHGPRSIFGENLEGVCAMSSDERYERLVMHDPIDGAPENFTEIMRRTLSEIDAWQEIERIREASRT